MRHARRRGGRPGTLRGALRSTRPPSPRLHARARRRRLPPRARQPRCRHPARGRGGRRDHRSGLRVRRPRVHPLRPALLARGPGGHGQAPEPGHRPPPARRGDRVGTRPRLHAPRAQLRADAQGRAPLLSRQRHDADLAQLRPGDRAMTAPYTLYVMSNSPYSDKIRMYLRLKGLPVVEVRENLRNREQVLRARTGRTMVPVVITPADEALNDSTHITRTLVAACPVPPLRPADPGRRGLDALLEDYADEWVVRVMLASRWAPGRWPAAVGRRADGPAAEHAGEAAPDGEALAPLARRIARTYLRFAVANAKALEEAPKGPLAVELADGVPFQAARAGYNRKCLQALLAELEAAVAAAGRLAGGAADREIFADLAGLGKLLAPYPALARAAGS